MRDSMTFEDRLALAVDAYAAQMPTDADALAIVRSTRSAQKRGWMVRRTSRSMALLLATLAALALLAAAIVGLVLSQRPVRLSLNHFIPTGSLHHDPAQSTAVLLADGRVLVVGTEPDADGTIAVDSRHWTEIYDPSTGQFSESLETGPSYRFTLTALADGRVLMAGALEMTGTAGRIPHRDASKVLDLRAGATTETHLTRPPADQATALLLDGRVMLAGGYGTKPDGTTGSVADAEIWDPRTGTATPTGSMVQDRTNAQTVTLADGRVLVFGGSVWTTSETQSRSRDVDVLVEVYDPRTGTFEALSPDPSADSNPVYMVKAGNQGDRLIRIDLVAGTTTDVTPYPDLDQVIAGVEAGTLDPGKTDCTPGGRQCRSGYTLIAIDAHHALIDGGQFVSFTADGSLRDNGELAPAAVLDPTTGILSDAGPVVSSRRFPETVRLADGRVLLFGGGDQSAEIYEP